MRYNIVRTLLLSTFLLTLTAFTAIARPASDEDDRYDYDETARVARISLLSGDVSLRRAGQNDWEHAALNLPLVEGDRIATGAGARVEIQIDARNFIRLGEYTTLDVVTLRPEGSALSLPTGTATLRLARFYHEHEYFEIDAPKTTVAAEGQGLYRLDVADNGNVRVTVRDGGRARIYSDTSGFTLRDGRTAEFAYDNNGEGDWEFSAARDLDSWDTWVNDREHYLAERLHFDNRDRYYDGDIWGAEELDAYGDWVYTNDYGFVWRPRNTVVNSADWAPYRYGQWVWCPPYGWTWVGDEPWGWAPYHYGRWVYYDNYWCWAPRGYYHYHHRNWWRPALVAFVSLDFSFGSNVCWYPLGYHQPDPRARYYRRHERPSPLSADELARMKRAVSTLPARDFGARAVRPQPAPLELARRVVATEPMNDKFSFRPTNDNVGRPTFTNGPPRDLKAKDDPNNPARHLFDRPTGAAKRLAGEALDQKLQRERIFNKREPRDSKLDANNDVGNKLGNEASDKLGERPTGAVARPTRPQRLLTPGATGNNGTTTVTNQRDLIPSDDGNVRQRDPVLDEREHKRTNEHKIDDGGAQPKLHTERPMRTEPPHEDQPEPTVDRRPAEPSPEPTRERAEPKYEPHIERAAPPREERHEERPAPPPREEHSSPPREEHSSPPPREERHAEPAREEKHSEPAHEHETRSKPPRA
jgi:FecR protein